MPGVKLPESAVEFIGFLNNTFIESPGHEFISLLTPKSTTL